MSEPTPNIKPPTMPRISRFLAIGMIVLAVVQAGAAVQSLSLPTELANSVNLLLPFEFVAAALWAGVFALVGVQLLRKGASAKLRRLALILLGGFALYSLAPRKNAFSADSYRIVFIHCQHFLRSHT
jgi:hypothetical protein